MSDGPWPPPLEWPDRPLTDGVVLLDRIRAEDADRVALGCSDAETQRWLPLPSPYGPVEARAFIDGREDAAARGEELTFALRGVEDGLLAGAMGVSQRGNRGEAMIGYWTTPDRRDRGWTTRALVLAARYFFTTYAPRRIEVVIAPGNARSAAVATAAGAVAEGVRRNGMPDGSGDALIFSLLATDLTGNDTPVSTVSPT